MTLEEAKKILEKEFAVISLHKSTEPFEFDESGWIEHEKPSVLEAFRVLAKGGYYISISGHDYNMREKRLKKEYEENTKAPGSSENRIKEDSGVNPALKESASQFNDALLDEQAKKIKRLTKKITRLNKIIHKKNMKIEEFRKESSRHLRGKIKMFGGNLDLSQELCDKNEELRLSKIREKNLTEVCQKYMKEVEELNEKAKSVNMHRHKELAEKDEVIADLGKELAATKKELEGTNNLVRMVRNASKEYCEYGIAAEKMIQKLSKIIVSKGLVPSDVFEKCRLWAKGYRFNPQLYDFIEEEEKKFSPVKDTHPTEDNPEEIEMDEILERVRKALEEGHTVSIDHDKAEEGGDPSGVIVLCGKDFVKKFKENEDLIHDLFEKKHKEIKEFMSAEAEQLFEGDGIPTKMEVMKPSRKFKKIK